LKSVNFDLSSGAWGNVSEEEIEEIEYVQGSDGEFW
jgi:hypothetical protein